MAVKGFFKACYLHLRLLLQPLGKFVWSLFKVVNTLFALAIVGITVYGLGFQLESEIETVDTLFHWAFGLFLVQLGGNLVYEISEKRYSTSWLLKLIIWLFMLTVAIIWLMPDNYVAQNQVLTALHNVYLLAIITIVQACIHLSATITHSLRSRMSPTWVFVSSFALICFIGSGLLMLPRCTTSHLSFIDALFTSVSAVCVTGLTTVDVATHFTFMGKAIIAILIQIGGIGIMTFTSFFGLFFIGSRQTQNKMMIKDLVDPEKGISQIFKTLWYIILVTFGTELIGAYAIFVSISGDSWHDFATALFHSISAFCNAGISTIEGGFMSPALQTNYTLHWIIIVLVVFGGLGFPIIFNLSKALFLVVRNFTRRLLGRRKHYEHIPHLVTSSTYIVLVMTMLLLLGGAALSYFTECHNLMVGKDWYEQLTTAFFMSATTRSAGFNSFDTASLTPLTLVWMMAFMWIGASPMSTGGGVKTTTVGIAFLNIWNTLRGRTQIEIRHRRISETTVNRAFIIIFASFFVAIVGLLLLVYFEPDKPFLSLLFETVSATSIAGLSLGTTAQLCQASRIVIIVLMFVGRIGIITLLSTMIRSKRHLNYQYPTEIIPIN